MTARAVNRLDLFVVGTDSALYVQGWNGSAWSGYGYLGGVAVFEPVAVAWGPNRLDAFVIGTDSGLYHKWWAGQGWLPSATGFENLGGKWFDKPSSVSWGPDRLDVFLVGQDRGLYQKFWNGASWNSGFVNLGGKSLASPSVVSWAANRIDIFTLGTNSAIYHKYWDGSNWGPSGAAGPYEYLGGTCVSRPKAVSWGPNRIDIFCVGLDSGLYHKWWDGSNWGPNGASGYWENLGGIIRGEVEAVSWGSQRLDIFVIGMIFHLLNDH